MKIAFTGGQGPCYGRVLRWWIKPCVAHPNTVPTGVWGAKNVSRLDANPTLRDKLQKHPRGVGEYVRVQEIVDYLNCPDDGVSVRSD